MNMIMEKLTQEMIETEKSSDIKIQDKQITKNTVDKGGKKQQFFKMISDSNKKYAIISPSTRMAFIKRVLSKQATIKEAAQEFGIKFSTSKAILQTFRREGRVGKKKFRQRKNKEVQSEKNLEEQKVEIQPKQVHSLQDLDFQIAQNGSANDLDLKIKHQKLLNQSLLMSPSQIGVIQMLDDLVKRQFISQQLVLLSYANEIQKYKAQNLLLRAQLASELSQKSSQTGFLKEDVSMKFNTPMQSLLQDKKIPSFNLDQHEFTQKNL